MVKKGGKPAPVKGLKTAAKEKAPAKGKAAAKARAFKPPTLANVRALYDAMHETMKDGLVLKERFGTRTKVLDTLQRLRLKYGYTTWKAIAEFEARFAPPAPAPPPAAPHVCAAAAAAAPRAPARPFKQFRAVKKPIIYLYPRAACNATVRLRLSEGMRFTTLLPAPDAAGSARGCATWRVAAAPDGTLSPPSGPPVASLFWEAARAEGARDTLLLPEGARDTFCVRGGDAGGWLLGALRAWGLTPREYTECATFWAPLMEQHAFVQIRLLPQQQWEAVAPLAVEGLPAPVRTLRVFIVWRGLPAFDAGKNLGALPANAPARSGAASHVVEWGGEELPPLTWR